jgi:hypothetical protein
MCVRRGDPILGFVTSFKDGDTAIAYYIGFDRAAPAEGLTVYLRLLHATIDHAIAYGLKAARPFARPNRPSAESSARRQA